MRKLSQRRIKHTASEFIRNASQTLGRNLIYEDRQWHRYQGRKRIGIERQQHLFSIYCTHSIYPRLKAIKLYSHCPCSQEVHILIENEGGQGEVICPFFTDNEP
jgi:hypothetical protein